MGLRLHPVAPRQGLQWIRQGFALWWRQPLAFMGMFATALMVLLLLFVAVPLVGPLIAVALVPMLSLGYMIASTSVLQGQRVRPAHLIDGLRAPDPARRRAQWWLCLGHMGAMVAILAISSWVDNGTLIRLAQVLAGATDGKLPAEARTLLADPALQWGNRVRLVLLAGVSMAYWHAPALVYWGGQGAMQALFSSTLALWRARWALTLYGLGWLGLSGLATALSLLLGAGVWLVAVAQLALTAAFYVSLWFVFADSFGAAPGTDSTTIQA